MFMLVYFDSKDIISIMQNSEPCSADQLGKVLRNGQHQLVFSINTIIEISQPLALKGHHIGYPGLMLNYATTSVTHARVSCIHELASHKEKIE